MKCLIVTFNSSLPWECVWVSKRHAAFSAGYYGTEYDKTWWDSILTLSPLYARWSFETLKFFWSFFSNIHFPMAWSSAFDVSSNLFLHIFVGEISSVKVIFYSQPMLSFFFLLLLCITGRNGELSLRCLTVNRIHTPFLTSSKMCWKEKEKPEAVLYFSISVCSVIVNAEEWRYFKDLTKTCTPLEVEMFHMKEDSSTPQVYLRPRESLHIPLKYQSFVSKHGLLSQVNFLRYMLFLMLSLC